MRAFAQPQQPLVALAVHTHGRQQVMPAMMMPSMQMTSSLASFSERLFRAAVCAAVARRSAATRRSWASPHRLREKHGTWLPITSEPAP